MAPVRVLTLVLLFQPFGQAEVGDFRHVVLGQQDVGRLEIAVQDAALMGGMDSLADLQHHACRFLRRLRGGGNLVLQVAPVDEFQGEKRTAVGLAGVVNLDDIGVLQVGDGLRLNFEPGDGVGAGVPAAQDHFQGDKYG